MKLGRRNVVIYGFKDRNESKLKRLVIEELKNLFGLRYVFDFDEAKSLEIPYSDYLILSNDMILTNDIQIQYDPKWFEL